MNKEENVAKGEVEEDVVAEVTVNFSEFSEVKMNRDELVADLAYVHVEAIEAVGEIWWRWLVHGGSKTTNEGKSKENIWWRRSDKGGLDPTNEKRRGESFWWSWTIHCGCKSTRREKSCEQNCRRTADVPARCWKRRKK